MNAQDIARDYLHEEQTRERVEMIKRVIRKREQKNRTLAIRAARFAKYAEQGRI